MGEKCHEKFKVLGVETRVRIVELLKEKGELGSKEISEKIGITPAAVSQHLKVLKQAGLVKCKRQGCFIPYSLNEGALEEYQREFVEVCSCDGTQKKKGKKVKQELDDLKLLKQGLKKELGNINKKISAIENKL
jgi:ArsR family transcriptional regulator